jgi:hypothetical protein
MDGLLLEEIFSFGGNAEPGPRRRADLWGKAGASYLKKLWIRNVQDLANMPI